MDNTVDNFGKALQSFLGMEDAGATQAPVVDDEEKSFQEGIRATEWFSEFKQQYGEEPDLDTEDYDYRSAWKAGLRPERYAPDDNKYHWPSSLDDGTMLKSKNHPTAWKEYYMRETGNNPDEVGATEEDWNKMQESSEK